ncbi:MAG: DUF3617 domain-containing protein [Betaproteobacteria bacterium]
MNLTRNASLSIAFSAGLCAAAVAAIPNARPGLWETSSTLVMEVGLPARMEASRMSPAERTRMLQQLSPGAGKPMTSRDRMCMTADMLERWEAFASSTSAGCQRKIVERNAQHLQFSMTCGAGSSGMADFSAAGQDRLIGKISMNQRSGDTDSKTDIQLESRWISNDCGALKPGERQSLSR